MKNYKQGFLFLWGYSKDKMTFLSIILLVIVISSFLEGFSISLLAPLFQSLDGSSSGAEANHPMIIQYMSQLTSIFPEEIRLIGIAVLLAVSIVLKNIFKYFAQRFAAYLQSTVSADVRKLLVKKTLNSDLIFFQKYKYADLIDRINLQATYCGAVLDGVIQLFSAVLVLIIMVSFMMLISVQTTIIVFVGFAAISALIMWQTRIVRDLGTQHADVTGQLSAQLGELLNGLETIKVYNKESKEQEQLNYLIEHKQLAEFKGLERQALIEPFAEGMIIGFIISVVFISNIVSEEQMALSVILTYMAAMMSIFPVLKRINSYVAKMRNRWGNMERVISSLNEMEEFQQKNGTISFNGLENSIRFSGLSFSYPGSEGKIFDHADFIINKGEKVAIIGPSGAGKTTITKLFLNLYGSTRGTIFVDGKDLKSFEIGSLREKIGVVSQDVFLFHDSIINNISYGMVDISESDIVKAAKKAHAHEFIIELDEGYQTIIGDRGARLSGGQRQRIAIARAILKDPDILIFDEATSALDKKTEENIRESMALLGKNKTVIIVTHHLHTIQHVDKIFQIDNKKIKNIGQV